MKLTVNGRPRDVDTTTLQQFLESLGVNTQFVAVALNGEVLEKDAYAAITLHDGDTLEIVRPVGGG